MLTKRHFFFLFGIGLGGAGLGFDVGLLGGLLSNPQWYQDFGLQQGTILLGFTIASWILGALIAAIPSAFLMDYLGRKKAIMIGCIGNIIATAVQASSFNVQTFVIGRVLSGVSTAFILTAAPPYLNELCGQYRSQLTALSGTTFYFGSIPAAWAAYGALNIDSSWSWRLVLLLQIPWPIIQLVAISFVPESPRWLVVHDKLDEARRVLRYVLEDENEHVDLVVEQTLQKIQLNNQLTQGSWMTFLTKGYRRRLLLIILLGLGPQCVGNNIISYYLAPVLQTVGITDNHTQAGLNAALQVINWLAATLASLQCDRFGRKVLLIASATGMLLSMAALTACSAVYAQNESKEAAIIVIVMIFLFYVSYDIGFSPVPPLYITELVPTELRAKASGTIGLLSSIGIFINQWMNPKALAVLQWRYYFVYIGVLVFMIAALSFAPETKGLSLEDASRVCETSTTVDSEHAADNLVQDGPNKQCVAGHRQLYVRDIE